MSDHLQSNPIKVSGHLEDKRGIYQMVLSWTEHNGKRGRKSISTGLPVKGNKKRAEEMLRSVRLEQSEIISQKTCCEKLTFADFMEQWLDIIRPDIKITTFGGYQSNVIKL